jgi:hypothetical protein
VSLPSSQPRSAREAFDRTFGGRFGGLPRDQGPDQRPGRRLPLPIKPIVAVLSAILLVSTALDIVPAMRAGLHDGTRGEWVATTKACHGSACLWRGEFIASGGRVLIVGAQYAGQLPRSIGAGTRVPALFTGGSSLVYPVTGSDLWIELLVAMLLSGLGLYWASRKWLIRYLHKIRKTPQAPRPSSP